MTTLGLTTHLVLDISGVEVVDVDDDAMVVTSTNLAFPLSLRAGSCGSTFWGVACGVTLLQVGSCGSALLCGTCVGGDGHGLSVVFLSFRTHTIFVFFDVVGRVSSSWTLLAAAIFVCLGTQI